MENLSWKPIAGAIGVLLLLLLGSKMFRTIDVGHVGVVTLFGKVRAEPYPEGLHFPVNPLYRWHVYDVRQKTHKETSLVPTQDQLLTTLEVSVQYRLDGAHAPLILQDTGTAQNLLDVHLIPKLRSVVREQGKTIKRAEDFFLEETQRRLQVRLTEELVTFLASKGITIEDVLIRDISLPAFITKAIEAKKEREQAVERQKAELERFRTEQQQKLAKAEAELAAAEKEAAQLRVLADARSYEIEKITAAIGKNPIYVQLEALKALGAMSKDPAAKIYFINGDSPSPLPLMHIGNNN